VQHSREQIRDKDEAQRLERSDRLHRSAEELSADLERLEGQFAEDTSNVEVMIEMAEVHERLRDPEAALDLLERALSYRKDSLDLQQRVGTLKVKALKKAISRADRDGDQASADRLEAELHDVELAELQRRIELHPGDAELRLTLGRAYLRQERHDEALGQLQKAVGDPRHKNDALFLLGQCFQKKGFNDLAKSEFEKALSAHPSVDERAREILYNLGAIAEAEGNTAEARSCYARIYKVDIGFRDVASKMEQLR
jgi:tetratricopeptide (TPR) repeat protein